MNTSITDILLKLLAVSTVPVAFSVILYPVSKRTKFKKLPYFAQQLIIGLIFGVAAVSGTLFGVDVGGATANVRDAAPLCAGLLFGGPAGIIAGVIGGVYRWFASYFGAGTYSQVACSVSTVLAGLYAAALRRFMFENKRVKWTMGALVAVVMETVHLIILFLTHFGDAAQAYSIVKIVTIPMVLVNAFAVGLSALLVSLIAKKEERSVKQALTERIQQWLLLTVFAAYLFTTVFVYVLQTSTSYYSAKQLLTTNLTDVANEVSEKADSYMLSNTKLLASQYMKDGADNSRLKSYADTYGFQEINIVNEKGIITASTNPEYAGYDMGSAEQSAEFLILNKYIVGSYVQDYGPVGYDSDDSSRDRKYAGVLLQTGGFLQTGYDAEGFHNSICTVIEDAAKNRRIGQTGYILIADSNGCIVSDHGEYYSFELKDTGLDLTGRETGREFSADVYGEKCLCIYGEAEGFVIVAALPESEIYETRDSSIYVNSFMEIITFAVLFTIIFFLIKKTVIVDIQGINTGLKRIIGGKLDERLEISETKEMAELSGYINKTVDTLNQYIKEAAERMKKDLDLAKDIQHSALPSVFPPYPEISEFDVYATMNTAKEVGGDFYDFFLLGEKKLAFVVADVSGKGIPAAMFMMRAKTLIKSLAQTGRDAAEVIAEVNNQLCQDNETGMFVTAWFGILDYTSGRVEFVNAGHNPPLVLRKETGFSYLKTRAGLVLAGMEGIPYRVQELQLEAGDRIFLYTDGVTEATSIHTELYGEDRLLNYLNAHREDEIRNIPGGIQEDIDRFIEGAEQFDDITMMVLEYKGNQKQQ